MEACRRVSSDRDDTREEHHARLSENQLKSSRVENHPDRALAGVCHRRQRHWSIHDFRLQFWCIAVPPGFTGRSRDPESCFASGPDGTSDGHDGRGADLFASWKALWRSHESVDDPDISATR